ncbi:hypothetical protein L2E82_16381 [Cichorium intybus]|uniref:Uncharacterized protein n=1 Tax=Cichorium intybus TaxID=13427 RepID=A0ACB9F5D6_CICIN|nr:hypothetical protein L2E82_16381 [Cichorium intybus]
MSQAIEPGITLLSQLSHPNIGGETVSVYLEYVSGGSIHKLLQEYGLFRESVIQNYTTQVLCGLAYLHARNTVHRDIKGANILVDPNGEFRLADFGMSKHIFGFEPMESPKFDWKKLRMLVHCHALLLSESIYVTTKIGGPQSYLLEKALEVTVGDYVDQYLQVLEKQKQGLEIPMCSSADRNASLQVCPQSF